jgi:hypothetical protein
MRMPKCKQAEERSKGDNKQMQYLEGTPDAEPAKRSTTGPVPSEGKLFKIQHLYRSYAI